MLLILVICLCFFCQILGGKNCPDFRTRCQFWWSLCPESGSESGIPCILAKPLPCRILCDSWERNHNWISLCLRPRSKGKITLWSTLSERSFIDFCTLLCFCIHTDADTASKCKAWAIGDLFSAIGSVIAKSMIGIAKKRDLLDIYFASDFTRICQETLKFSYNFKKGRQKNFNFWLASCCLNFSWNWHSICK